MNLAIPRDHLEVPLCLAEIHGGHVVERSLMRPRNLLKLFRSSLSYAINLGHTRIESDDITLGLLTYAQDLVIEVDRELGDVFPQTRKLVYEFSEENAEFSHDDLSGIMAQPPQI
jgi:hypothetical protein